MTPVKRERFSKSGGINVNTRHSPRKKSVLDAAGRETYEEELEPLSESSGVGEVQLEEDIDMKPNISGVLHAHTPLDVESVSTADFVNSTDEVASSDKKSPKTQAIRRPERTRKRKTDNSAKDSVRYYDRYKNQDYVKRNDCAKYCQICRKKVFGKLRSLPSEHRLRRMWILRFNLDAERSAELWVREAFSDATHCGEACPLHFPIGSENLKSRELLPVDMRQDPTNYSVQDDKSFDFDSLELECVYCDAKCSLRNMVPFSRTRSRRYKWITALAGEEDLESRELLSEKLKIGTSKFLCDWHFNDNDFDINQFGEWRLRKEAIPDPTLCEADKHANRIYMVNHGDTILSRNLGTRSRREDTMMLLRRDMSLKERSDRSHYRYMTEKLRRTYPRRMFVYDRQEFGYDPEIRYEDDINAELDEEDMPMCSQGEYIDQSSMARLNRSIDMEDVPSEMAMFSDYSTSNRQSQSYELEFSDDSDEELDAINKVEQLDGEPISTARFCQVCSRVISSEKSMMEHKPRTWPFDDVKHEKWLEIMNWPRDFEDSMRVLWVKRRNDLIHNGTYHFCPINICQTHIDFRNLHEKVADWLQSYCVLCDEDLKDPNLLLPFPADRGDRLLWMHHIISGPPMNKLVERRWKWLRERLTRPRATRYRLCVYHFEKEAFVEKEECIEFNQSAIPLPLGMSEYDITPRGPQGLIKCPLCDMWGAEGDLAEIRAPSTQAERILLVEMLSGDKNVMKKGIEQLAMHPCKICKAHLPPVDPYSVIAERRLVSHVEIQCIQCNSRDIGANMVPLPVGDDAKRAYWVEALCRDNYTRTRLNKRLEMEGRHYLCTAHFHKNSLRYIPGLGVWKRFVYMPLAITAAELDRTMRLGDMEINYEPLLIAGLDDEGVALDVTYDEVSNLLGETMEPIYGSHQVESDQPDAMYHEIEMDQKPPSHICLSPPTEGDVDRECVDEEELQAGMPM